MTAANAALEDCALCGRSRILCRRDDLDRLGRPIRRVVCDALHRVFALERFRRPGDKLFLREEARPISIASGRSTSIGLSIGTLALVREWRRILRREAEADAAKSGEGYRDAVRLEIAEAISSELIYRLILDLAEVDLDASIGDRCPRCGSEKSADDGARDYRCRSCVDAAREEAEHGC